MAKTRLNETHRRWLKDYAREVVDLPKLREAADRAHAKAAPLVRALVEAKYPPDDMDVLKRYKVGSVDDCIKLNLTEGGVEVFEFPKGTGPYVAKRTLSGQIYNADRKTTRAILFWIVKRDAHKEKIDDLLRDFNALIDGSRNFEDLVDIWPEADALAPDICSRRTALVGLGPEVIGRIQSNVAERAKHRRPK